MMPAMQLQIIRTMAATMVQSMSLFYLKLYFKNIRNNFLNFMKFYVSKGQIKPHLPSKHLLPLLKPVLPEHHLFKLKPFKFFKGKQ